MHIHKAVYSDKELVRLLKTKDLSAYEVLYDNYAGVVFGTIVPMIQDKLKAEQIFQQVFSQIWAEIAHFDSSKESLLTWILSLTRKITSSNLDTETNNQDMNEQTLFELVYHKGVKLETAANQLHISLDDARKKLRASVKELREKNLVEIDT